MAFLYFLNVFFFIPVYIFTLNLYRKSFKYSFYSIPSFLIILSLPILLIKRIGSSIIDLVKFDDPYFQFSILMDNFHLCIVTFQIVILLKYLNYLELIFFKIFKIFKIFNVRKIHRNNSNLIFYLTLFCYIILFLILTNTNTNTVAWILNPRNGYQFSREGAGIWYAFSIIFLGVNSVILFIYRINSFKSFSILAILYTYLWYLFGGKAYLISFFALLLLSTTIHFHYKMTKRIFIVGLYSVSSIILLLFFNKGFDFTFSESVNSIFRYFDHYYYSSQFYSDVFNSKFDFFYGKIYATNFYKYIPRIIFSDKPYVYGSVLLNEIYTPGMAELGHTPEFAGQASYFADFGILGVLMFNLLDLNFLVKSFFYILILKNAKNKESMCNSIYFAPIVFSFAPAFSQFISFPFDIFLLILFSIIFSFFYKKKYVVSIR